MLPISHDLRRPLFLFTSLLSHQSGGVSQSSGWSVDITGLQIVEQSRTEVSQAKNVCTYSTVRAIKMKKYALCFGSRQKSVCVNRVTLFMKVMFLMQ